MERNREVLRDRSEVMGVSVVMLLVSRFPREIPRPSSARQVSTGSAGTAMVLLLSLDFHR